MQLNSPKDLFLQELYLIYDAEHSIREFAKSAAGKVQDQNLAQMLNSDAQEIGEQIQKLEQCFRTMEVQPQRVTCNAIEGIRKDYESMLDQSPSPDMLAMSVVAIGMKIEHYEVASYRGLVDKAMVMGETEVAQILQSNLVEEEESASRLERLSQGQRMLAGV